MQEQLKKSMPAKWRLIVLVIAVLWLLLAAAGVTYFVRNHNIEAKNKDPMEQAKIITAKASKIYLLPADKKPTVAEIKDVSKLRDQQFYANAQNGDFLLLYQESQSALIYRESSNKLIIVAPVAVPGGNGSSPQKTD